MKKQPIKIGDRVKVFCHWLFKNDIDTPLSVAMKEGTVVDVFDYTSTIIDCTYHYKKLLAVKLDYDGRISRGHFSESAQLI